jgi:hypothetical protein
MTLQETIQSLVRDRAEDCIELSVVDVHDWRRQLTMSIVDALEAMADDIEQRIVARSANHGELRELATKLKEEM